MLRRERLHHSTSRLRLNLKDSLTFTIQDSHLQFWVPVKGLQLLQQTPRRLLVHRVSHPWAVYRHSKRGTRSL